MAETALPVFVLRIASPAVILLAALSVLSTRPNPDQHSPITSVVVATTVPRRAAILSFLSLSALTYLADGLVFVVFAVLSKQWPRHSGIPINTIVGLVGFAGLAAIGAWKDVAGVEIWSLRRIRTAVSTTLLLDIALTVLLGVELRDAAQIPEGHIALQNLLHLALPAFRVLLLFSLLGSLVSPRVTYTAVPSTDDEVQQPTASSFLLPPEAGHQQSTGLSALNGENSKYGTFRPTRSNVASSAPATRATTPAPSTAPGFEPKPEISLEPTWSELFARIRRLSPYLWPSKSRYLQFVAILCIVILVIGRVVNLALPLALGKLISSLEGNGTSPWPYLFGYVGLRYLQGSGGLSAIRDALWAPVMQYSDREMSQLAFDHILNLSFAWHTRRKTGEILRVLDRGAAINHTFELILFNIVPTFVDIFIALAAFCWLFEWTLAAVIFVVMFSYVAASVILTKYRTRLRRQMNDRDVITRGIHTDVLLNYETVKYFGGEDHEGERYREAMREYQKLELKVILSLNLLNLVQNFIITVGLLVGSMMVADGIVKGRWGASEFVIFITYLAQLYGPLNQLGYIYRSVNQSLVDTERLLALLNEPTEVNDKPNAPDLVVTDGEIEFRDVCFSYDERTTALNKISFKVPKGCSVALVGESGSGKSTILRLLYRFYDLKDGEGAILIDGQDIRDVTQKSLRHAIGVVPQDSVLFNTTISYNIGYGKFGSSQEEIEEAARSAQMHDRIMSFPNGYETKVGERGVRLSGGEKQRVSIARTLLKNPPILLLDEATSALDTSTEKDIQKALQNLVQGRSSLSIAHRLSTIASADLILVLKEGQIIEQGTHAELLALDGVFASMWADQVSSSDPISRKSSFRKEVESNAPDSSPTTLDGGDPVGQPSEPAGAFQEALIDLRDDTDKVEEDENKPVEEQTKDVPKEPEVSRNLASDPVVAFPSSEPLDEEPSQPRGSSLNVTAAGQDGSTRGPDAPVSAASPIASAPIAFPASDSASVLDKPETSASPPQGASSVSPPVPFGVTFEEATSPPRNGTPDPDAEPKRKRTASQNFQRLARRISLTTRRQGSVSSILPVLKRETASPRGSTDEGTSSRGEGSSITAVMSDSPAPSMKSDEPKPKLKKKDKKRKSTLGSP
ncbi:mitochondrial half-size ABC transporter [Coprinopsis cinerea okayama7|uniref:Mitochondrial half-size ABC transporter n=1 Tax=Coprinopsis cinerea (strain Okayama-7 / 130 / ATCC MYA-4618 / FGSC 9003) TaxID=240176 RepID=D6RL84_COPC7|nr:mitochondrial half-size ABC transporter [Coprinopsis cinerea okayama7\|eukprot:XP_002911686.1 mitochondrial half-size ABC transporter [Coprinopsis cinerea okayama7\